MATTSHVVWLQDCGPAVLDSVGGKAHGLGALLSMGLHVPNGFAVTTAAYREHVEHNNMRADLERLLSDVQGWDAQQRASESVRDLFAASEPAPRVADQIRAAY